MATIDTSLQPSLNVSMPEDLSLLIANVIVTEGKLCQAQIQEDNVVQIGLDSFYLSDWLNKFP